VLEVADIFRQHAAAYRSRHRLLPSQARALEDIQHCRTVFFGGHLAQCDHCGHPVYAYHSCRNRHCPKCHGEQTRRWLEHHQQEQLPCPYYLLTFTLPAALRPVAFAHQRAVYGAVLRCAAAAVLKLARDPQYLGGVPAILAVLHTWTRDLRYHPHVHLLVSAGGAASGSDPPRWVPAKNPAFLVPVRALSVIFRAKTRAALRRLQLPQPIAPAVWTEPWVVHAQPAGRGEKTLAYLARYVFRVALSNSRLEAFANGRVTFRYRDNRTQQLCHTTLSAEGFIGRFLQHALPKGLQKVRAYGLANGSQRDRRRRLVAALAAAQPSPDLPRQRPVPTVPIDPAARCPHCRVGRLILLQILRPQRSTIPP
jgi:hypothetical protein